MTTMFVCVCVWSYKLNIKLAPIHITLPIYCVETQCALFSFQMQPDAKWRLRNVNETTWPNGRLLFER